MSNVILLKVKFRQDLFRVVLGRKGSGLVIYKSSMRFFGHKVERVFSVSDSTERWISMPLKWVREHLLDLNLVERVNARPCVENLPS